MRYPVVHGVPALPDFGKCENGILEIDNGRFYGYNKAILVAEYMKKVRWIFFAVKYMKKGFSRPFLSCRAQKKGLMDFLSE